MALTKILNDENKSFQPVLTDKLVYDTKPTVNSFNGITSDAVARAIAGASGEVPAVTESDNGKVLTAVYDEGGAAVEWAEAQGGIPDYSTSDDGKVLGVTVDSSGETPVASVDWVEQSGGLPSSTGWDSGKVLTVDSQGTPGWATPASPYASFNTTFDLIDAGSHNSWYAYVQQSSSPAPTIDLPVGVYAYRVEAGLIASAAVDDVYNIEVRVGNGSEPRDCKAVGLQSDSDNVVSIWSSGIIQIVSGSGISKAIISVKVSPAKSSGASSAVFPQGSVQLKLARL